MNGGVYNYDYDPIGNRIEAQMATITHAYLANSLNQYTNVYAVNGPLNYNPEYDADGNMLTRAKNVYTYDMENRLVMASNTVTDIAVTFQYDHQSRRICRTVFNSSLITQHSSFIYDGWNLISEQITDYSGQTEVVSTNYYTWGLDLSGSLQGAGGVGGLLSVSRCGVGSQNQYYSVCDSNGNITEYVDEGGSVVAHYEYDSFGSGTVESGAEADDFCFRFSSKYYGPDSGLYYYGYRYYRPKIGRWLSRDPIEENGGLNVYGFVGNDGVDSIDRLGLSCCKYCCVEDIKIVGVKPVLGLYNDLYNMKLDPSTVGFYKDQSTSVEGHVFEAKIKLSYDKFARDPNASILELEGDCEYDVYEEVRFLGSNAVRIGNDRMIDPGVWEPHNPANGGSYQKTQWGNRENMYSGKESTIATVRDVPALYYPQTSAPFSRRDIAGKITVRSSTSNNNQCKNKTLSIKYYQSLVASFDVATGYGTVVWGGQDLFQSFFAFTDTEGNWTTTNNKQWHIHDVIQMWPF